MNKRLAKRNFISMSILVVILIALCFVNFLIPATNNRFVGFANAITTDLDISGGYSAQYNVLYPEGEINKTESLEKLVILANDKIRGYGYESVRISISGESDSTVANKMFIEIPKLNNARDILNAFSAEGELYIRTSETTEVGENDLIGEDVLDIFSSFGQVTTTEYMWGTNIQLSKSGEDKIKELTSSGNGTIYIYIGENVVSNINFKEQITGNLLYFYGSSSNQEQSNAFAFALLMAKQSINFEMIGNQINTISATLGENTLLFLIIAISLILALFIVAVALMFGDFAWLIAMSMAIHFVLMMFFLQAIPIFILSMGGFFGLVLTLILLFASYNVIFGNIKKGYAEGKKIPLAVKSGYSKSILTVVDINVLALIISFVMYFAGGPFSHSFSLVLGIGAGLNLLATLVLTKWFTKWYLSLNSTKANKLRMKRGANINELG
ncbi:MAG: hypothetical protein PHX09_01095 [Clostridia bacterium]|nr:hypothetical protein [Clostridia bacterium]MDD4686064.1 hypothetical protein [Clostridia bacterium]